MPSILRQRRLRNLIEKRAKNARIWPAYAARVREIQKEFIAGGGRSDTSRFVAANRAAREFPEIGYDELVALDKTRQANIRKGVEKHRIKTIAARVPKVKAALLKLMSQEEVRISGLRELDRTKRLITATERRVLQAQLRHAEAKAKKEEARAEANKVKAQHYYWLKKVREEQMAEAQQAAAAKAEARQHGIVVEDPSEVDIVADTKWVYGNLAKLIVIDKVKGHRKLNVELLEQAPSNGAIAIAMFALENQNDFMTRFAMKLFPKEAKQPTEDNIDLADELDPTLGEMANYMGTK